MTLEWASTPHKEAVYDSVFKFSLCRRLNVLFFSVFIFYMVGVERICVQNLHVIIR